MKKRLAWEKNWLKKHGWQENEIWQLENDDDETPVEYLTERAAFAGLELEVTKTTLIPRLETEQLVELLEEEMKKTSQPNDYLNIIEVGTGSGAIAIALAKALRNKNLKGEILATEISEEALRIAAKNVYYHHEEEMIKLKKSDLLSDYVEREFEKKRLFDQSKNRVWLVANLPYIPHSDYLNLDKSVKDYEPASALDGGEDGLVLIGKLLKQVVKLKKRPELIALEIDPSHKGKMEQFAEGYRWEYLTDDNQLIRLAIGRLKV